MNRKLQREQVYKIASELEVLSQVDSDIGRLAYQTLQEFESSLEEAKLESVKLGRVLDKYSETLNQLHGANNGI